MQRPHPQPHFQPHFQSHLLEFLARNYNAPAHLMEDAFAELQQDLERGQVLIVDRWVLWPAFFWIPAKEESEGRWVFGHVFPEHRAILQLTLDNAKADVPGASVEGAVETLSALARTLDKAKGAAKQVANDLMRRNAAIHAEWQAENGLATFTDTETGKALSPDEVKQRFENEGKDVLPIKGTDQLQGADMVNNSLASEVAMQAVVAIGSKGRIIAKHLDDVVDYIGDFIKGKKGQRNTPDKGKQEQDKKTKKDDDKPKDLVLKMDCGGYPFDEAPYFKMKNSPERWKVRPTAANGASTRDPKTSDSKALKAAFIKSIEDREGKLTPREVEILNDMLRPAKGRDFTVEGMSAQEIVKALDSVNASELGGNSPSYKISYHHLRPTWAGGENKDNVFPVRPGHQTAGIHNWWNDKLTSAATPAQMRELLGGTEKPMVKTVSENNIGKIAERLKKKKPPRNLVIEMHCPEACCSL